MAERGLQDSQESDIAPQLRPGGKGHWLGWEIGAEDVEEWPGFEAEDVEEEWLGWESEEEDPLRDRLCETPVPGLGDFLQSRVIDSKNAKPFMDKRKVNFTTLENNSSKVLSNPTHEFWFGKAVGNPDYKNRTGFKGQQVKGVLWYEIEGTQYVLLVIVKVKYYRGVIVDYERRNQVGVAIVPGNEKKQYKEHEDKLKYCNGRPQYHTCEAAVDKVPPKGLKIMYTISSAGDASGKIIIEDLHV